MPTPRICATVTAATTAELCRKRDAADADLVELRLDSVSDPSAAAALAGRRTPVIVTCRPTWEGGGFAGSEEERQALLAEALSLGAEYVDVEWKADCGRLFAQTGGRRIIVSSHDFDRMPQDLPSRVRAMRATGAEVVKVAGKANRLSDCVGLLDLAGEGGPEGGLVLIAMGDRGIATRVLAGRFGSMWTYAGAMNDIGQVTLADLTETYRFSKLTTSTDVYGIVGSPVGHSVSPAMHNAAFEATGLDAVYLPLDAADADDFVTFARAMKLKGASVTIPFKVALFERVDEADPVARRIGALNTIRVEHQSGDERGSRWLGANTDVSGFLRPIEERSIPIEGLRASVLGAGGAARAVAIALAPRGAEVTIHARDRARAQEVATIASARAGAWPPAPRSWDLLVNCTPLGIHPRVDETPIAREMLAGGRWVYDLIYNPPMTRLLREAADAGCQTIGGLDMLVAQAHEQFQWWTGIRPPAGVMQSAAMKRLSEFAANENHVV